MLRRLWVVMAMPDGPRCDDESCAWTRHQAAVLRSMPVTDNRFDRTNLAGEIASSNASKRGTVRSRSARIIENFLKLAYSALGQIRQGDRYPKPVELKR